MRQNLAQRFAELRADIDFDAVEYKDDAAVWPVPAVVTATGDDGSVPVASVEEFAAALLDGEFAVFDDTTHAGE